VLALAGAVVAVAGLVGLSATRSSRRSARELRRLDSLAAAPDERMTREQADDGAVLARKYGRSRDEARFSRLAERLRRPT